MQDTNSGSESLTVSNNREKNDASRDDIDNRRGMRNKIHKESDIRSNYRNLAIVKEQEYI